MPRVNQQPQAAEPSPDYQLTLRLLEACMTLWRTQYMDLSREVDPMKLTRLGVVAFTQVSATLGVDVGMTQEQFVAICNVQFAEAYKRAPKFG